MDCKQFCSPYEANYLNNMQVLGIPHQCLGQWLIAGEEGPKVSIWEGGDVVLS